MKMTRIGVCASAVLTAASSMNVTHISRRMIAAPLPLTSLIIGDASGQRKSAACSSNRRQGEMRKLKLLYVNLF
jgi:hypothetical protein